MMAIDAYLPRSVLVAPIPHGVMVVQFVVFERETLSKIGEVSHPLDFLLFLAQEIARQTQDALHDYSHYPNLRGIKSLVDKSDTRCDARAIRQYIFDERRDHSVDCETNKFDPLPHNVPSK
jgi:hypothetical protein